MRGALKDIDSQLDRGQEAVGLIDKLLDWAISNRRSYGKSNIDGKECRFVSCYTYHGTFPQVLIDALKFMGEPVNTLRREKRR